MGGANNVVPNGMKDDNKCNVNSNSNNSNDTYLINDTGVDSDYGFH